MLAGAVGFFAAVALINWLVNPYGVWRVALLDDVYRKRSPGQVVSTPYRLRIEAADTILLGSSRVLFGMDIPQGARNGVLNAALPGAHLDELLAVIAVVAENPRVRRIIWGVDPHLFNAQMTGFRDPAIPGRLARAPRLLISETLLNTDALWASGKLAVRALGGRASLPLQQRAGVPWSPRAIRRAVAEVELTGLASADDASIRRWVTECVLTHSTFPADEIPIRRVAEAVARLRASGIQVQLFIPPMSVYELEAIRQAGRWEGFLEWKQQVLEVGAYWDFTGYGELASREDLFDDVAHAKPVVGHLILRHLWGLDCDQCGAAARSLLRAGVWVDGDTIAAHLRAQDASRLAFSQRPSRVSERVTAALAPPASADRRNKGGGAELTQAANAVAPR